MMNFKYSGLIETYKIVNEGRYVIECWGASGGGEDRSTCGLGAYSRSTHYLHEGDVLKILVAGKGAWDGSRGGGGGGSFVELNSTTLLCCAGGGGGSMFSRLSSNYSHGQAGQQGGNYNLTGYNGNISNGGSAYAGGGGAGYIGNGAGMTCTPSTHAYAWLYGGWSFKNGGAGGYGNISTNAGGYTVDLRSAPKGGFGGGGSSSFIAMIGYMSGIPGYYYNGAGGGGGYSGGDSTRDGYGNTGGGGGSYYVGTTGIELAKAGYEDMPSITDKNSTMKGNFGDGFARISVAASFIFSDENNFYIPTKDFFDIDTRNFKKLTLTELETEILNKTRMPISITGLNTQITVNGENINPLEIIDLTKYKICVICEKIVDKLNLNYIPSNIALSKTNIKVKNEYTPVHDELEPTFLNINSNDKSKMDYFLDFGENELYKNCNMLNSDIIINDFYLNLRFNSYDGILNSITLYGKNNDKYTKLKSTNIDIYNRFNSEMLISFKDNYKEVLVNSIAKQSLEYTINTLDKF
ncbi:hypothetical protein B0P06_006110 [Clostridium saccharoperbutylacetonicum]|uniref:Glycine rich protein n=1 Tax=Clostridium saccharoperbutylacetonicum N1-4(HMT) TaxID=931276 RepID=M1MYM8_9CLOT|nr:glycine-rich protein [Clostridium saccharoperbutylacetonicum]AGF59616.1 glycine rich protein [Clostridium saccharoperbutylacetonicum N1-4(HMT)]NRT64527.1 hypothetical protein [Clostridium saccharoperbutylacetonicum]NSB29002.1 hypothetical protein [Clostridium saccharoperbutylacetonicum]NSB46217.1 hypothetical protein [Clostridium saccharoperbutylacetonicum]